MWIRTNLFFLFIVNVLGIFNIQGQNNTALKGTVSGNIQEKKTSLPIPFGTIAVINLKDSSIVSGAVSDEKGNFKIESIPFGNYYLKIPILNYQTYNTDPFSLSADQPIKIVGIIKLKSSVTSLKTVTVEGKETRVEQSEDTVAYNAKAFKTNPDATAEDLITKMPGITSSNGTITAHGENVTQVFVDGKPFFGDDPNMAIKNLPAEIIEKIQGDD